MTKLQLIQQELTAPKSKYNSFGKFNYRSCEDILEALKPLLKKHDCLLFISDKIVERCGRCYVEATVTLRDDEGTCYEVTASAQDSGQKSGMDAAQVTGAASSYARKYALNGLFLIDDNKDPDTDEYQRQVQPKAAPKTTKVAQPKAANIFAPQKTPQEVAREYLTAHPKQLDKLLAEPQYSHVGELDHFTASEMLDIYNRLKAAKLVV